MTDRTKNEAETAEYARIISRGSRSTHCTNPRQETGVSTVLADEKQLLQLPPVRSAARRNSASLEGKVGDQVPSSSVTKALTETGPSHHRSGRPERSLYESQKLQPAQAKSASSIIPQNSSHSSIPSSILEPLQNADRIVRQHRVGHSAVRTLQNDHQKLGDAWQLVRTMYADSTEVVSTILNWSWQILRRPVYFLAVTTGTACCSVIFVLVLAKGTSWTVNASLTACRDLLMSPVKPLVSAVTTFSVCDVPILNSLVAVLTPYCDIVVSPMPTADQTDGFSAELERIFNKMEGSSNLVSSAEAQLENSAIFSDANVWLHSVTMKAGREGLDEDLAAHQQYREILDNIKTAEDRVNEFNRMHEIRTNFLNEVATRYNLQCVGWDAPATISQESKADCDANFQTYLSFAQPKFTELRGTGDECIQRLEAVIASFQEYDHAHVSHAVQVIDGRLTSWWNPNSFSPWQLRQKELRGFFDISFDESLKQTLKGLFTVIRQVRVTQNSVRNINEVIAGEHEAVPDMDLRHRAVGKYASTVENGGRETQNGNSRRKGGELST